MVSWIRLGPNLLRRLRGCVHAGGVSTYRSVLRVPGVASALLASMLGRLPIGAVGLVLILRIRELGGSYAAAGVVAGAFTLGNGISAPLLGRAIDRLGQTRVLVAGSAISGAAIAAAATPGHGASMGAFAALSALAGLAMPPLGGCVRVLLGELIADAGDRHAAFALEASAIEVIFLVGPLAIVGGVAAFSPQLALGVCAALMIAGTLAFAGTRASRQWRPAAEAPRSRAGALRSGAVRALLGTFALAGTAFGAVEVTTAAFAQHHGMPHAVGPLLALWALASLAGGVIMGRLEPAATPARRIALLLAVMAGGNALLLAAPSVALLALALVASGLPLAPLGTQIYALTTSIAPAGAATESTTWLTSGISAGFAAGSALGGALISAGGTHAGYALAVAAVLAALLPIRGSAALRPAVAPA
jgi:MFS family permease